MLFGTFTYGYKRNPLEHAFIDAKKFGYDYVELWGGRPHAFAPDLKAGDINKIKALIDRYEMPVRGYTPEILAYPYNFMDGTEAMREDAINYLKLSMDMAKEMGADFTLWAPPHAGYYTPYNEIWTRLITSMRELVDHAEKIGHKIVLEAVTTHESNVCTTANDLARVLDEIDSSCLVGMCDVVPPFIHRESIMAYFDKLGDKMYHLHIIDSDSTTMAHLIPGEGDMPFREMMAEIEDIGFAGTATIELVSAYVNEPRFYARRAIDNLRRIMEQ